MILKKPYAFLIKNFKLIHLVLTIVLGSVFYYSMQIISFFNAYISNGYRATTTFDLANIYTPFVFMLSILAVVILSISLYILLLYKKKPNRVYLFLMIYYIILFGAFFYLRATFSGLERTLIGATESRIIRDLSIISIVPQLPFVVISLMRSVGFNLRNFNFQDDFHDMDLGFQDNEAVEIELNINSYKFKRRLHKSLRELKYYILENKFVVSLFAILFLIFLVYFVVNSIGPSYTKNYNMGQSVLYQNFDINVQDALLTQYDYRGDVIKENSYYLILKTKIKNETVSPQSFDINTIKLVGNDLMLSPMIGMGNYFKDFTRNDTTTYISGRSEIEVLLCYELTQKQIKDAYRVIIFNGTSTFRNQVYNKAIYINIRPRKNFEQNKVTYDNPSNVIFSDELLKGMSFKLNKVEVARSIKYDYKNCIKDKCTPLVGMVNVDLLGNRSSNYLVQIDVTAKSTNEKYKYFSDIVNKFGKLSYVIGDTVKQVDFIDVTPDTYKTGAVVEAPGEIRNASSIYLIISTRFDKYTIKIK